MNPSEFLRETVDLVKSLETRFLELGARLYRIKEEKLYASTYDTFTDFLETAHINPSQASILVSIHKHYIVDGKQTQDSLRGAGYSNLYESIPLIEKSGIERAVAIATTLSRSEIKDTVREKTHGEHEHNAGEERFGVCETCGKFMKL